MTFRDSPNWQKLLRASLSVPLAPEAFHARFPVFFSQGFAVRAFGQRPKTCLPAADEATRRSRKKPLVVRVVSQIKSIEKSVKEVTYVCP